MYTAHSCRILFLCSDSTLFSMSFLQYSINKSSTMMGLMGRQCRDQGIIAELDSALNEWEDSVPSYCKYFEPRNIAKKIIRDTIVRWDPNRGKDIFFEQSVALYCLYHQVQMLVHRPFLTACRNPQHMSFSASLTMCTRAARSVVSKVDSLLQAGKEPLSYSMVSLYREDGGFLFIGKQLAVFNAGVVLLLSMWIRKRSRRAVSSNTDVEMRDFVRCMSILKSCEHRFVFPSSQHPAFG